MELDLYRRYYAEGTNGRIECEGHIICHCIELPWKENQRLISCIPEGRYRLVKRYSLKFKWHIEITGVPNRNLILFHPANYALTELNGCIAHVVKLSGAGMGFQSRIAFGKLKSWVYTQLQSGRKVYLNVRS